MTSVEYDVYLSCRGADDHGMASDVAAGLARSGFRVCVGGRDGGTSDGPARAAAIDRAPDFVLLSSPAPSGAGRGEDDPRTEDLAHAFETARNILVLADPAHADPLAAPSPPGLPALAPWQRVEYDRGRPRESIALVAHRLLSSSDVEDRRLMRMAKRAFIALGAVLALALALRAVPAVVSYWNRPQPPPPLPRFAVYWSASGQRLQDGRWHPFPVTDGAAVSGGDRLRVVFGAGSDGYAYVVLRDIHGAVSLLYPDVTLRGASRVRAGSVYQAPAGGGWLQVDPHASPAAIYLFAGHEPLENLEELLEESDGGLGPAARLELLTSTLAGLLDGRHAAAPRPLRIRGWREIVDDLPYGPPPAGWPRDGGGSAGTNGPAVLTGLVSVVVEISLARGPAAETSPRDRE